MRGTRIAPLIVACVAVVAYGNSVFHGFVYDDDLTVAECSLITSWSHIGGLFTQAYFRETIEMSWRPLVTLSHFLDHSLFGTAPWGYHLMNVLWHAAACIALYALLRSLVGGVVGAAVGACLFAVHPLVSEPVNAVSFREDLIAALFVAAAVALAVRALRGEGLGIPMVLGSGLASLLACLAKETGLVAPLIIALWWVLGGRRDVRCGAGRMLALAMVQFGVMLLYWFLRFRLMVPEQSVTVPPWGDSAAAAVWNFPRIFFHGLWLTLWPQGLSADREWEALALLSSIRLWLGWCGILLWLWAIWRCRGSRAPLGLGMGWWLLSLLPVSNLIPLANPVADRYFYLPLMGIAVIMAWCVERATVEDPVPLIPARQMIWAMSFVGIALLAVTVNRNLVWGDAGRLWEATLDVEPNSTTALNNLGCIRLQQGRPAEAAALLERGIDLAPGDTDLVNNWGIAMVQLQRWDEARRAFEWSVLRVPGDPVAHWRLALCLANSTSPDHGRAWDEMLIAERMGYEIPESFRADLSSHLLQENSS
ncbi:tetratricopeptide repeat protein [Candidatus Sumerlaeota bacterium]|nr:tetratricopeptide repeat protein [Candidatus Sumerlaeota bacterium]